MIKIKKVSAIFLLIGLNLGIASAQNLVLNPSFETTNTNCSQLGGEGFRADLDPSWDNANSNIPGDSCSSPDLFSACNLLPIIGGPGPTFMPNATSFGIGWQYSRTGTRHAGFIAYSSVLGIGNNYREYIQGHTSTPLVAGVTYCVSFYVSLGDGCPWAVKDISVYFSNAQYLRNACTQGSRINVTPQLNNCTIIQDTANWVRLQWDYVATGGERYFVIGNFNDDAATTKVAATGTGFGNSYAYYFIDDVSISANSCCAADISPVNPLCISDAPVTLTAVAPVGGVCSTSSLSGTWGGPGVSTSGVFSPATAGPGTHTVTFTLSCGTVVTRTITVSPCVPLVVCRETNGNITASNGVAPYSWQNQTTTQDCSACLPATPPFIAACSTPPGCAVMVTTWTTFATGTSVPAPTTFPVKLVDNTGATLMITSLASLPACTTSPCPTITVTVSSQTPVGCGSTNNGTATVAASGGAGPYQYVWTPGNLTGATQNNLAAGTYTVVAQDAANVAVCTGSTTVTIGSSTSLSLTGSSTPATCGLNNGSAQVSVVGGTGTYTYAWSPTGGTAASTPQNLAAGNYTVTVTGGGCTGTTSVAVASSPAPTVDIVTINHPSCAGLNNGSLTYSINGGAAQTTPAVYGAGATTITVTDASGCEAQVPVTFVAPTITVAVSTVGANCGASDGSATVTATGGTGPYTYTWSPSGGSAASATGLHSGAYSVVVADINGCSTTQPVNVPALGGPTLALSNVNNATCGSSNGSATVTATGGTGPYTYSWSPSGGTGQTASGLSSGNYTVSVTDAAGCVVSETAVIGGGSGVAVTGVIVDENCGQKDGSISITATGGTGPYTYAWTPGGATTQNITALQGNNYSVTVTDAAGCTTTKVFEVEVIGSLPVTVSPLTTTIEQGDTVQLNASGGATYIWTPAAGLSCATCNNPQASPTSTTVYHVTATDANGCSGTANITVYVNPVCTKEIFVPTIFSPNGDGINDQQCVLGNCIVELNFSIYNRWGEKVFETEDQNTCWDGTYKGKKVNSGVFVYKLKARLLNGTEIKESGNINVIQ